MIHKPSDSLLPGALPEPGDKAPAPGNAMVTRVPVFEGGDKVWGYDLLLGDIAAKAEAGPRAGLPGDAAALSGAFALVMPLTGKNERLSLPLDEGLILNNTPYMFPADICCLSLGGRVTDAEALGRALADLKQAGYLLMLPFPRAGHEWIVFLPLADIVRVDIREFEPDELKLTADWLKAHGAKLLACNVTPEQTELCLDLDFTYLQGDVRTQGTVVTGKSFSSSQVVKTRLLKYLADPDWTMEEVAALIRADVSLAYRLLRYLNSAYFSLPNAITSIESSVLLLGRAGLEQWAYVTILADLALGPLAKHTITTAAFRGKFLELLARESTLPCPPPETLFLVGLFSMLETLLNLPLRDIAAEIKIDEALTRTLQGEATEYRAWFSLLLDYERGRWDEIRIRTAGLGLTPRDVSACYTRAITWTTGLFN